MNPYSDTTFWTFFSTLVKRMFLFVQGKIPFDGIATDEVQIIVLAAVGGASAILGTWLTLRRMAMLANALSHTLLLGIVGVFLLYRLISLEPIPTLFSVPFSLLLFGGVAAGLATALITELLRTKVGLQEDASIGIVFTAFFAFSLLIVNLTTRNAHIGVEAIIGNIDALQKSTIFDAIPLFIGVALFEALFRKELLATTFDSSFSKGIGISTRRINFLLMTVTALLLTLAFQAVGVIQVLSFLVVPPLFAGRLSHSISKILPIGVLFAVAVSLIGVALSRHLLTVYTLPISTGSLVVTLQALFLTPLFFLPRFRLRS